MFSEGDAFKRDEMRLAVTSALASRRCVPSRMRCPAGGDAHPGTNCPHRRNVPPEKYAFGKNIPSGHEFPSERNVPPEGMSHPKECPTERTVASGRNVPPEKYASEEISPPGTTFPPERKVPSEEDQAVRRRPASLPHLHRPCIWAKDVDSPARLIHDPLDPSHLGV